MAAQNNGMFVNFAMDIADSLRAMAEVLRALVNGERDLTRGSLQTVNQHQLEDLLEVLAERERSPSFRALLDHFIDPETVRRDSNLLLMAGLLNGYIPVAQRSVMVETPVTPPEGVAPKVGEKRKLNARTFAANRTPLPPSRPDPGQILSRPTPLPSRSTASSRIKCTADESDEVPDSEEVVDSDNSGNEPPLKKRSKTPSKDPNANVNPDSKPGWHPTPSKKIPGSKPVPGQQVDRKYAQPGKADPSKYTIVIKYQKKDKKGKILPTKTVKYQYLKKNEEPKWDNAATLKGLNKWRSQVLNGAFGTKVPPKKMWLKSEQNLLLELVQKQFDRKNTIKWKRLANSYNNLLKGKVQSKGEELISIAATKTNKLNLDRVAPWRTHTSIKAMAPKWAAFNEMQAEANRKQRVIDESEEIPDSDSEDDAFEKDHHPAQKTTAGYQSRNEGGGEMDKVETEQAAEEEVESSEGESDGDSEEDSSEVEHSDLDEED
ncbi:hypothetical protein BKA65DRAFT_470911 [Rhexocercosporidium sp. MPI-PUGE-AT-0058]|nr:hypothetical protein BKA65DRAFT_470911 [Rhexocercosporidium sp. MPI-PUGE-AT-0058]